MKITVLGGGAYGIALAKVLFDGGNKVTIWTKVSSEYTMLAEERCNKMALPNFKIDKTINITMDLSMAIKEADIIFIATSIQYLGCTVEELKCFYKKKQYICIACKGISQDNATFASVITKNILKTGKISVISGGTFAVDLIAQQPSALVLASKCKNSLRVVSSALENNYLKVRTSNDILGVQLCGAIKNVIAILCGIIDGMQYSDSTKSMIITKAINDISNLIYCLGGSRKTILSYAGIGDLWLTCTSTKSRNYSYGLLIGSNCSKSDIEKYEKEHTVEGLYTLKSLYLKLSTSKYNLEIINMLYKIIYEGESLKLILSYLK